ncbi:hypothetical protein KNU10_gp90 [Gordonia phage Foxboro]|uniref:Uncharacterized protein n=1 Tax=Gordonia phage Foxboro TaxID=2301602 RepID=A0A385UCJ1_9CAUD|nr:hypothetical protein KNU10_gp90 [Gordonia phage Foxboro]AYB69231.1 hypothetical protein SEA_FOXBORO_90 [Gordonia phage Foxboro]
MTHNTLTAQMFDALASVDLGSGDATHTGDRVDVSVYAPFDNGEERELVISRDRAYPDGLGWRTYGDYTGERHHRTIGDVVDYVGWYAQRYGDVEPVAPVALRLFDGGATVAV